MGIILNELHEAERIMKSRELGRRPYESLVMVAKLLIQSGGSKRKVRSDLESFVLTCDSRASIVSWTDMIDSVLKAAYKYPPVVLDAVSITINEIDRIKALKGKQVQRLAFTLLCISKYMEATRHNGFWVGTPDNEIMAMANINTSIKRQSGMFGELRDCGMIRFSKKVDNLSVQVLFAEDGPVALTITDFRNLGYQYMRYNGGPYFECENCGMTTKMDNPGVGRRQKYCKNCAAKIKIQQSVGRTMHIPTTAKETKDLQI